MASAAPLLPALGMADAGVLGGAAALRYWVIATLGDRWTTRVVYVPGDPIVATGPFRWMRHPNYLVVTAEFLALPLAHTAWVSAAAFGAANVALLRERLRVENALLARLAAPPRPGAPGSPSRPEGA